MLLQQACNNLFTYTHTLITKVVEVNSTLDKDQLFCANYLRSFVYMNFFHAADFILDMMSETVLKVLLCLFNLFFSLIYRIITIVQYSKYFTK